MVTRISRDPHKFLRWLKSLGIWNDRFQNLYDAALFTAPELRGSLWISLSICLNGTEVDTEIGDKIHSVFNDKEPIPDGSQGCKGPGLRLRFNGWFCVTCCKCLTSDCYIKWIQN